MRSTENCIAVHLRNSAFVQSDWLRLVKRGSGIQVRIE